MTPQLTILSGDCRDILIDLPDASVQCCVTSPPYWKLRDYNGNPRQIGQEPTPEEFIKTLVNVFREVRRILKNDGTLWVNMGDSYCSTAPGTRNAPQPKGSTDNAEQWANQTPDGMKPKDLVGIPWMLAFALRADGWYLRQDIIWAKSNPMPESVKDRCTKSHEYIFLLSKSERYFYDQEAIREECSDGTHPRKAGNGYKTPDGWDTRKGSHGSYHKEVREKGRKYDPAKGNKNNASFNDALAIMPEKRNKRSVWTVPTAPCKEAHFATYPPDLIKPCILAGTRPGDTVIDPFGGSGTTGAVALELGRSAILIELEESYLPIMRRRTNVTPGFL